MTLHRDLANAELHEQKGISTASDNQMYISNGAGSGDWSYILDSAGTWTYSSDVSSVEFTDLGNYSLLQIDLVGITLGSPTNQYLLMQLGNDSGYTTSSVYYNQRWDETSDDTLNQSGMNLGLYRNSSPANTTINISSYLLANFNIERYTVCTGMEFMDESTTTSEGFSQRVNWVREKKAYNKLRITPVTDDFTGGSIVISGYRYHV